MRDIRKRKKNRLDGEENKLKKAKAKNRNKKAKVRDKNRELEREQAMGKDIEETNGRKGLRRWKKGETRIKEEKGRDVRQIQR